MDSLLKQTIPKFHPGTKMFIPCSCNSPMGGDWWLSWEGGIVLYSHPVIQDPSILFTDLSLFPLSPHYLTSQYRKRTLMATWVFVWGRLEVMLLGTSHHIPGLSHMLRPATREFRKSKISVIKNPLSYCSKLVFEVYHFMGNRWGNRVILYFGGSKITADGDCSNEINNIYSLEGKLWPTYIAYLKAETLLCQQRSTKSQGYGFTSGHVWMWELDGEESWEPKNWCFWTVVLEKTLESPLDCKKI